MLVLRGFEFTTLNVRWDQNAYGSIVWVLLGLHTTHVLTDAIDTFVVTALMFTKHAHGKRFSDVEDNAIYWDFVVLTWLPIYVLDLLGAAGERWRRGSNEVFRRPGFTPGPVAWLISTQAITPWCRGCAPTSCPSFRILAAVLDRRSACSAPSCRGARLQAPAR